jgi:NADPH:quinone reductase-like Zn-dependent oxidoreductase
MKAIVCEKYNSVDALQLKEVEKPAPKDIEIAGRIKPVIDRIYPLAQIADIF